MSLIAKRISNDQVFSSRSSLADILEALKSEPGQWMEFEVSNGAIATQIKRHKGFDARTRKVKDIVTMPDGSKQEVDTGTVRLQAVYVGPEYQASFIPRVRKAKKGATATPAVAEPQN